MKQDKVIPYLNKLKGFRGYVQFSHRPIDKDKDIFIDKDPDIKEESGFIYEAYFSNGETSVTIRQVNDDWLVDDEVDISDIKEEDIQTYLTKIEGFDYRVKMAQIWEDEADELCEGMAVKKLKKVVFAGFEKGGKQ